MGTKNRVLIEDKTQRVEIIAEKKSRFMRSLSHDMRKHVLILQLR